MGNFRGAVLMSVAMALFTLEDMFVKRASVTLPVGEVLVLFGLGGMAAFALLALRARQGLWHPAVASRLMLVKAGFEMAGRIGYSLGLALIPLSTVSAILQATPLVVVAGAALFFRERVGVRRWAAIGVGFVGVLVILRPGFAGFVPAALWTVLGLLGFAGRDLATRAAPKVLTNFQLGIYGFAALAASGGVLLALTGGGRLPALPELWLVAGAVLFGVTAYWALTAAMRMGEVSVVTPFRYTRLVFALILGMTLLGERPDGWTLLGAALIVASGVYTLLRGARR